MTGASLIGLAGCGLVLVCFTLSAARARRLSLPLRGGLVIAGIVVASVPIDALPLAGYIRGLTGDLSITTWLLLAAFALSNLFDRDWYRRGEFMILMFLILVGGLTLYPFALGLTYWDPYTLGYDSRAFLVVLLAFALWAAYRELYLVALCLTISVLAHSLGLMESRNLWDYLIDPWITFYALGLVLKSWARKSNDLSPSKR